jgi:serine protease
MSETVRGKRRSGLIWLLVLLAVFLIWWFWRPPADNGRLADESSLDGADADEILVDFRDDNSAERVAEVGRQFGLELRLVSRQAEDERLYRAVVAPERRDEILAALARLPDVEVAEPDATYSLIDGETGVELGDDAEDRWKGFPNDPEYKFQWHLDQINMPKAWKIADGKGVVVAVIDTGVAYENYQRFHRVPDLAETEFVKGYDFVGDSEHAVDDHAHGTHVAGTIAQSTHNGIGVAGVGRKVKIMPLKVLSASGSGSVAAIADAIHFAADNGAKVINMSLGGRFRSAVLEKAVKYAHDKGVTVVCAAGNDGSKRVSYPAAYPGAVAVAATQYDETTTFYSNAGKEIDVAAPGGNTQVDQNGDGRPDGVLQNTIVVGDPTRDGYFAFMGTSMASPHAAGVAALIVGAGVTEPKAVEKILKDSARDPKGGKADPLKYGAGIIDANAAVLKAKTEGNAWTLGLGALLLGAVTAAARRRGAVVRAFTPGGLAGLVAGASGLFFLPHLGVDGFFAAGFPQWGAAIFGASLSGNALFYSVLAPLALVVVGLGIRRLRATLAGFAAGVAATLIFQLVARTLDITWIPGATLDAVWLATNGVAAAFLAYIVVRDER